GEPRAAGSHEPLARVDRAAPGEADEVLYYHTDVNGAPEEMTDGRGNIVWEAGYQVWGNLTHEKETRPVQQNLRFQGQYLDRETGLHYNLYRFYDPDIGKFISGDPIGLNGGINLYQYAPNPLSWIDPLGLSCIPNKVDGDAREAKLLKRLQNIFGKENVLSQRHLRNAQGKIVGLVDEAIVLGKTKGSRILDFVVKTKDGWKGIEVTSKTASKVAQRAKERAIRDAGGIFVRDPATKELIELDDLSRIIRLD
ncbi:RHS repeat domain-containing protein, partial [Salmonella enterica]|uniref:RHS repeat domain-containing protein n=1 Tax=Salmonella enterica TaxID=28901 RepID=UPI0021D4D5D1